MFKGNMQWNDEICSKAYKMDFIKTIQQDLLYLKNNYPLNKNIVLKIETFFSILETIIKNGLEFLDNNMIKIVNEYLLFFSYIIQLIWKYEINVRKKYSLVHSMCTNDFSIDTIKRYFMDKIYLSCSCVNKSHCNLYNENKWGFIVGGNFKIFSTHYFDSMTFVEDKKNFKTIKVSNGKNISCWECTTDLKTPCQIIEKNIGYQDDLGPDINYNEIVIDCNFDNMIGLFCLPDFEKSEEILKISRLLKIPFHKLR